MSLKNVCMAQCFKGPRLQGEKEGFVGADLAAWQANGRALLPVWFIMLGSVWLPLLGCKSWGCPQALQRGPIVLKFALFPEGNACALLTSPHPNTDPFYSLMFHPSPSTLTLLLLWLLFPFGFEARATTGNNGCSHIDNQAVVWQIPRHFTDQQLSQN